MERSYISALQLIESLIHFKQKNEVDHVQISPPPCSIEWMRHFIEKCDVSPQPGTVIHIAGTKGKGTTSVCCEALLRKKGLRTALFTSPHLRTIRERIQINGEKISEIAFTTEFFHLYDCLTGQSNLVRHDNRQESDDSDKLARLLLTRDTMCGPPKSLFFSFMTLLFLSVAKRNHFDVLIIEVGIGGRLDATNAIDNVAVSGITSIGYDHMETLGDTLQKIAREKAGIIRSGTPVVISHPVACDKRVSHIFFAKAESVNTDIMIVPASVTPDFNSTPIEENPMMLNAPLGIALASLFLSRITKGIFSGIRTINFHKSSRTSKADAHECLIDLSSFDISVLRSLKCDARWNVRIHPSTGSIFLIDGAHTVESMAYCARWALTVIRSRRKISEIILLFSCNEPRDPRQLMDAFLHDLAPLAQKVTRIYIPISSSQTKSLTSEINLCKGHFNTQRSEQDKDYNLTAWQRHQFRSLEECILDKSNECTLSPSHKVTVTPLFLKSNSIFSLCSPGACIISCGSLYHAGDLLQIIERSTFPV